MVSTIVKENSTARCSESKLQHEDVLASTYIVYKSRWYVLFSFCLLSMVNAWIWITFSPFVEVLASTQLWKGTSESEIDALSGVYFYIYVPFSFVSLQLLKQKGLRFGLLLASTLNLIGSFVRLFAIYYRSYATVYVGTIFCALAQTFTLSMPPMLSGHWFSKKERGTATAIVVLSNSLGTAVGLGATVFLKFPSDVATTTVKQAASLLSPYLFLQFSVSALASISSCLFVQSDSPPTPPSRAALQIVPTGVTNETSVLLIAARPPQYETDILYTEEPLVEVAPGYRESIRILVTDPSGISFTVAYGLSVGCYYSIPPFFSQLLSKAFSEGDIGLLGILYILGAVLGGFIAGLVLDKADFTARRIVSFLLLGSTFFVFCLLCLSSSTRYMVATNANASLFVTASIIVSMTGFFLGSLITAGFEFGTAISYPADEAAAAGVLECSAELVGFIQVSIGGLFSKDKSTMNLKYATFLLSSLAFSVFIFFALVRADSKRPLNN